MDHPTKSADYDQSPPRGPMNDFGQPTLPQRASADSGRNYIAAIIILAVALTLTMAFAVSLYVKPNMHDAKRERMKIMAQLMRDTEHAQQCLVEYLVGGAGSSLDQISQAEHRIKKNTEKLAALSSTAESHQALASLTSTYQKWSREFAQPLIDKRKQVDAGNATVAELQIFYLNQNPDLKSDGLEAALMDVQTTQQDEMH